ncbi:MAG TPA: bifunctional riboflavin kinase/FAD synthetase [Longimicrobiaceae bacterium]|nr:bifunctional riboflavin kinase/FAD synthetase [Longimicrobiaceae bacterium]
MEDGTDGADVTEFAIDPALPPGLPRDGRGTVVTVGTFDGVHLGHRHVLAEIARRAERTGRRSVLVTFHPHPLYVVRPPDAPPMLTTLAEKKEILAESGLEYVVFVPFTPVLQQYPARRFVEEILIGRVDMRELVIGYDHGFGRGREGGVDTLRSIGGEIGFDVDVVEAVEVEGEPVSSSRIRRLLGEGNAEAAARLLGRRYWLDGQVVTGERKGRELGFPTANVRIADPHKMLPAEGIYAAWGWVGGERLPGLLHLGPRPTFEGFAPTVELYLLDWSGDIYGEQVRIEVATRLRGIEKFASVDELVTAMKGDEAAGRAYFAAVEKG